jgi:hypothetical protein
MFGVGQAVIAQPGATLLKKPRTADGGRGFFIWWVEASLLADDLDLLLGLFLGLEYLPVAHDDDLGIGRLL